MDESSRVTVVAFTNEIRGFSYYEYKYLVTHEGLSHIRSVLDAFSGHSDPYPFGVVDSIYYDTYQEELYAECLNGEAEKSKFRIRGYGDGRYLQVHQKLKNLSSVSKYKAALQPITAPRESHPVWDFLKPRYPLDPEFAKIMYNARCYGHLIPSIRVKYFRYRYRAYDYRMTLDTNIEVFAPVNGLPRKLSHATLPHHVLEIKTTDNRPKLPFIGLIKLPQISFSKFMNGIQLLTNG